MLLNMASFTYYMSGTGVRKQWMQRSLTMSPGATPLAMITSPFVHMDVSSFAVTSAVFMTAGRALALPYTGYLALCLGSSLAAAVSMRNDNSKSHAGGLGLCAGMLSYGAFSGNTAFVLKFMPPQGFVALGLMYGLYNNDCSVLGGVMTGYALFAVAAL